MTRPALFLALVLAACGGGGDDDAPLADGAPAPDADPLAALPAPVLPDERLDYTVELPDVLQTVSARDLDNTPADNAITDAGATLGRVLFYDRRLSRNGAVSCGSCHAVTGGFSDDEIKSTGFAGALTRRNSMPLIELRFYGRGAMFWDERAPTLEDQALRPIQDEAEMGLTLDELVARVGAADYYPALFTAAFGDPAITTERIGAAIAQFERSVIAYRSRFDEGVAATGGDLAADFPDFTAEENRGKEIFFGQHDPATRGLCGTCHMARNPLAFVPPGPGPGPVFDNVAVFQMIRPANNGLSDAADDGVGEVVDDPRADGTFKSPSLRNVALTAPYMHDGRFPNLEDVVAHYSAGIEAHPNLDPILRDGGGAPIRLNLSGADIAAVVAFLHTLTDETIASDPRFTDPYPR